MPTTQDDRFAAVAAALADRPGVTLSEGSARGTFGSGALKVGGSIFAMLRNGGLVLKLPRDRVAALLHDGRGVALVSSRGRPMAEWVTLVGSDERERLALAGEALDFVAAGAARARRPAGSDTPGSTG